MGNPSAKAQIHLPSFTATHRETCNGGCPTCQLLDEIAGKQELLQQIADTITSGTGCVSSQAFTTRATVVIRLLSTAGFDLENKPAYDYCGLLLDENDSLNTRQQELLQTIKRLSNEVIDETQAADMRTQIGALMAEVGTLRAELSEAQRERDEARAELRAVTT